MHEVASDFGIVCSLFFPFLLKILFKRLRHESTKHTRHLPGTHESVCRPTASLFPYNLSMASIAAAVAAPGGAAGAAHGAAPEQAHRSTELTPAEERRLAELRAKYSGNGNGSGAGQLSSTWRGAPVASSTQNGGSQMSDADTAAFNRLDRVKICPDCHGHGTVRKMFHHYYTTVDCERCNGDGYLEQANSEALLRQAADLKAEGAKLFKGGDVDGALALFTRALRKLVALNDSAAQELRWKLMNNQAACYLTLQRYQDCLETCDLVLRAVPGNVKALFRKSRAVLAGQLAPREAATQLLEQVLELEPDNTKARAALSEITGGDASA